VTSESSDFTAPATDRKDWRVCVYLNMPGVAPRAVRARSAEVANVLRQRVRGRVVLRQDGCAVDVYTRTPDAWVAAQRAVGDLLAEHGVPAHVVVERWHPIAQQWEMPEVPLPANEAAARAERTPLDAAETRESLAYGAAMYDVRVELPSHRETVELAARLTAEGYSVVRRWRLLAVGANNADQAAEFEAAIRQQVPESARLSIDSHISPFPPRYD
jgi:hypothetical protein